MFRNSDSHPARRLRVACVFCPTMRDLNEFGLPLDLLVRNVGAPGGMIHHNNHPIHRFPTKHRQVE